MRLSHWWWDGQLPDPADWFEDLRDVPESGSFEKLPAEFEPRIDSYWDQLAEDRIARGLEPR